MRLADRINVMHFKESVTGETLFFFGPLPWPSSWTGYIVTSDDDIAKIKSYLGTYQWLTNLFLAPVVSVFVVYRLRSVFRPWVPDSEMVQQILAGVVAALAVMVISAFVFRRFVLDPIIHKYPVSQEKMSRREIEEKMAVRRSRRAWVWPWSPGAFRVCRRHRLFALERGPGRPYHGGIVDRLRRRARRVDRILAPVEAAAHGA